MTGILEEIFDGKDPFRFGDFTEIMVALERAHHQIKDKKALLLAAGEAQGKVSQKQLYALARHDEEIVRLYLATNSGPKKYQQAVEKLLAREKNPYILCAAAHNEKLSKKAVGLLLACSCEDAQELAMEHARVSVDDLIDLMNKAATQRVKDYAHRCVWRRFPAACEIMDVLPLDA